MEESFEGEFTPIPNKLLEALYTNRISREQMQVLLYIIRKTYGFKENGNENNKVRKKQDRISFSQFIDGIKDKDRQQIIPGTNLSKRSLRRAIQGLQDRHIISVRNNAPSDCAQLSAQIEPNLCAIMRTTKQNINKSLNKSAKREREFKKDSLSASLYKPMSQAEKEQRAEFLRQQADAMKKGNSPPEQQVIEKLKAERVGVNMPSVGICSVCGKNNKLAWNTGGYLICFECGQEDWLDKVYASYNST